MRGQGSVSPIPCQRDGVGPASARKSSHYSFHRITARPLVTSLTSWETRSAFAFGTDTDSTAPMFVNT